MGLIRTQKPMPVRWEAFCRAYVTHFNQSKAVIEAGYSPNAASVQGSELMKRPEIKERIAQLMAPAQRQQAATADRVIQELTAIAFSDVRELYDEHGRLKPIHELEAHVAAAISEVTEERRVEGRGEDAETVYTKKVKNWDKMKALEMLAKSLRMYSDAPVTNVQQNNLNAAITANDLRSLPEEQRALVRQLAELRARAAEPAVEDAGPS